MDLFTPSESTVKLVKLRIVKDMLNDTLANLSNEKLDTLAEVSLSWDKDDDLALPIFTLKFHP